MLMPCHRSPSIPFQVLGYGAQSGAGWSRVMDQHERWVYAEPMTIQMNIAEAKARLSELVARTEAGEEVVIARGGKPVVTLTPLVLAGPAPRRLGVWEAHGADLPEDLFIGPDDEVAAWLADWTEAPIDPAE